MAGGEIVVAILDQMKEFDEEIRPARPRAKEFANLAKRVPVKLPPLGESSGALPRANIEGPPVRASVGCSLLLNATLLHSVATPGARPANGLAVCIKSITALGADRQVSRASTFFSRVAGTNLKLYLVSFHDVPRISKCWTSPKPSLLPYGKSPRSIRSSSKS